MSRALSRSGDLRDAQSVRGWLGRVLATTLVGTTDERAGAGKTLTDPAGFDEQPTEPELEVQAAVCFCLYRLLSTLKPTHSELIWRIDLLGEPRHRVAISLGLTLNNVNVKLHHGCRALKARLEAICLICSEHGTMRTSPTLSQAPRLTSLSSFAENPAPIDIGRDRHAQGAENEAMARFLLAIVAVLVLAVSPITAWAASTACGMDSSQAIGFSMASMDSTIADRDAVPGKSDPCCGEALKGCAMSCSMICVGGGAILAPVSDIAVYEAPVTLSPSKGATLRAHPPARLDRPPKSMA